MPHPLAWAFKYFLLALGLGITVDQAIGAVSEIREPAKGIIFRGDSDDNVHGDGDEETERNR